MQNMAQSFSLVPLVLDPTGRTGSYWMIPLAFVLFWFDIWHFCPCRIATSTILRTKSGAELKRFFEARVPSGFFWVFSGFFVIGCDTPFEVLDAFATTEAAFNFAALTLAGRNDMRLEPCFVSVWNAIKDLETCFLKAAEVVAFFFLIELRMRAQKVSCWGPRTIWVRTNEPTSQIQHHDVGISRFIVVVPVLAAGRTWSACLEVAAARARYGNEDYFDSAILDCIFVECWNPRPKLFFSLQLMRVSSISTYLQCAVSIWTMYV